ncbi:MAG: HAMP domain-containing histidine kinase [Anaerolineae bacterium]|nr:HAMP domain-containing histidine kinase [Anaerolineae bacterium]
MPDLRDDYDSQLISIVAHDLKTPVSAVRGFLDLIGQLGELNDLQLKYFDRAHLALDRMENLITTLLDFARLESGTRRLNRVDVDMVALIESCADFLIEVAAKRNIQFHLQLGNTPIIAPIDNDLLSHVITNLLSNAIKYNREGGNVWVSIVKKVNEVRVDVRDSGIGISLSDQQHVFDRFFRANRKDKSVEGTGLGLAICKTAIDLHGGHIWVTSEVGIGSTFSFTVPLHSHAVTHLPHHHWGSDNDEGAGEISDDVDDNLQERAEKLDADSTHDDL